MIQLIDQQPNPRIFFTPVAKQKIDALVSYCDKECALEGTVYINEDGEYIIDDVFAYPQVITSATVEMDEPKYVDWLNKLPDDIINHKRFQVHSHVNMGVSPSGTDIDTYKNYINIVDDFMIFMIVNKRHEFNIWLYDMQTGLMYDKDSIEVGTLLDPDMSDYDWYTETYKEFISKKTYTYTTPTKLQSAPIDYIGSYMYGGIEHDLSY